MSTLKTSNIANLSGTSTSVENVLYGTAKAWVNFNGTGTVAIRASYNVSSITDNGAGDYTVNFTTAMVDVNYSVSGTADNNGSNGPMIVGRYTTVRNIKSVTQLAVYTMSFSGTATDCPEVNLAIFR